MRILLTRPRADSEALAQLLEARGHRAIVEPLLDIVMLPGAPVAADGAQAILFTSANGVRALVARNGGDVSALRALPVYAVGDATARAAREAGFAAVDSAAGDVRSLAALVASRRAADGGPLLHVAGADVAGDLAGLLGTQGFTVTRAAIYEAKKAEGLSPEAAGALRRGDIDAVLFFSPRSAAAFVALANAANLAPALGRTTAICLSPAVAEAADDLSGAASWRDILTASEPTQDSLLVTLDRFVERETRPAAAASPWSAKPDPAPEAPLPPASADPTPDGATTAATTPPPAAKKTARPGWGGRLALAAFGILLIGGIAVYVARPAAVERLLAFDWLPWATESTPETTPDPTSAATSEPPPAPTAPPAAQAPAESPADSSIALREIARESDAAIETMRRESAQADEPLAPSGAPMVTPPYEVPAAPVAEPSPELLARLADLEARLGQLADRPAVAPETLQNAADAVTARLTHLDRTLSALTQKLETQSAEHAAERERLLRNEARALGALALRDALDRGTPFAAALADLRPLAQDAGLAAQADLLAPAAATGLSSLADLRDRLTALAVAVARPAEADGTGLFARLWRSLARLVVVRRVDDETRALNADDPADRLLARAERRLAEGDLAEAIGPVEALAKRDGLAPNLRLPLESWLRDARVRLAAEQLLASMLQRGLSARQAAPR